MVEDELGDGVRIGQLLSSEIHGHEREDLGRLAVVDAEPDVEPTPEGSFAFAIVVAEDDDAESVAVDKDDDAESSGHDPALLARVFVHPGHVRVDFTAAASSTAAAAADEDLKTAVAGPEDGDENPQRTQVLVTNGAEVKPALRVVRRAADDLREDAA